MADKPIPEETQPEETAPEAPTPAAEEAAAPPVEVGDVIGIPATPADDHPGGTFVDHIVTDLQPDGTPVLEPVSANPTSEPPAAELPPSVPLSPQDIPPPEPQPDQPAPDAFVVDLGSTRPLDLPQFETGDSIHPTLEREQRMKSLSDLPPTDFPVDRRTGGDPAAADWAAFKSGTWDGVERRKGENDRRHAATATTERPDPTPGAGPATPPPPAPDLSSSEPEPPKPKHEGAELGDAVEYEDPDGKTRLALCVDVKDDGYVSLAVFYPNHLDFVTE